MEPKDMTHRRHLKRAKSKETHKASHTVGLFLYGFLRGGVTVTVTWLAFDRSIMLLNRPNLILESTFRLGCGVVAGMVAYGLSAWIAKPFVYGSFKKWWAPWSYESGYRSDAFIVAIGLLCAMLATAIALSVGIVSLD